LAEEEFEIQQLAVQYDIDLSKVKGTGPEGGVTKDDILRYIKELYWPRVLERRELSGIRVIIASRLHKSYSEAVHVTLNTEAQADSLLNCRSTLKNKLGIEIPLTLLIAKLTAKALEEHRELNATFEDNDLIIYEDVNINIAVDTPIGLLTPVIRKVNSRSIEDLYKDYIDVMERARAGFLKLKDFEGGTFTITNLGIYDIESFTPIINPPQVAILGVGKIKEIVVYRGEELTVIKVIGLSLSFDHRVIDGAPAARFLQSVKRYIENPSLALDC